MNSGGADKKTEEIDWGTRSSRPFNWSQPCDRGGLKCKIGGFLNNSNFQVVPLDDETYSEFDEKLPQCQYKYLFKPQWHKIWDLLSICSTFKLFYLKSKWRSCDPDLITKLKVAKLHGIYLQRPAEICMFFMWRVWRLWKQYDVCESSALRIIGFFSPVFASNWGQNIKRPGVIVSPGRAMNFPQHEMMSGWEGRYLSGVKKKSW